MGKGNGKAIYFECYGGISGDMTVAALLDMGADERELRRQLDTLPLEGFSVEVKRVKKSGLDCCDFNVVLEEQYHNHDHDIIYLYGHRQESGQVHEHVHDGHEYEHVHDGHEHEHRHDGYEHIHEHDHDHGHPHGRHDHIHEHEHVHDGHEHIHEHDHGHGHPQGVNGHVHRTLKDVTEIIERSGMADGAKKTALDIFRVLAEAEAKAHGETVDSVHFHEVGAVDSIVDIAAAAICLDNLGINEVIVPELYEGRGTVRCAHGILPIPVPAVMHIAAEHGLTLHMTNVEAELVTPTGAAIAAAVRTAGELPAKYRILATGMGAGKRDYGRTSILRTMIVEDTGADGSAPLKDDIYKLESNIDDCTGETLGYAMERLFAAGARDVSYMPIFMKKNRPAYQINIICSEKDIPVMEEILFRETTTIGIRRMRMERTVLDRDIRKVETSLGEARVKICDVYGETRIYPEYESAAAIAAAKGLPYREVWERILKDAKAAFSEENE